MPKLLTIKLTPRLAIYFLSLLIISNLIARGPDLYAYLTTPTTHAFSGQSSWFDPWDLNVYFSAINHGQSGHLFYLNRYDSTASTPVPAYLTYTILGLLTQNTPLSPPLTFHLAGIICSLLLLLSIYWIAGQFIPTQSRRILVTAIVFLGGGLGALFYPTHILPDLGQPQFTFYSPLRNPHDALSLISLLLSISFFHRILTHPTPKHYFFLFFTTLITTIIHPFLLLPIGLLFTTWAGICYLSDKTISHFYPLIILALAGVLYYFTIGHLLYNDPSTSGLKASNLPSANLLKILLGYGHFLPFILIGLYHHPPHKSFISCWFVVFLASTYLPIEYQRLFIRSLWFPAILLALTGFDHLLKKYSHRTKLLTIILIILSFITPLFITSQTIKNRQASAFVYLPLPLIESFNFLTTQAPSTVLAYTNTANLIPVYTDHRVWAGHPYVTPDFPNRNQLSAAFYHRALTLPQAQDFLQTSGITYIYWSNIERQALKFPDTQPFPYPELATQVFAQNDLQIYKVN